MTSKHDEHHALRRYALIDPLVGRELERGETSALLEELADTHGISVSTVKRYRRRYEEKGIEGLKPQSRRDAGRPRKLPEKALKRAIQLRTELPSRSTPVIIRMLEHEQPEWKGKIKRSTLDDHFRRLGITDGCCARTALPGVVFKRAAKMRCGRSIYANRACGYGTKRGESHVKPCWPLFSMTRHGLLWVRSSSRARRRGSLRQR